MITIQNGKLHIPDEDRFVGFAGDNAVLEKQFVLLNRAEDGCTYTLFLRYDNDTVRSVPLTSAVEGGNTVLTWEIRGDQLVQPGVVTVQLRFADSDGNIAHTTKDFFLVGSSVELHDDGSEAEYVTPSQLRNSINQVLETLSSTAPYVDESGYWYVFDPQQGEYQRTGYHVSGLELDSAMSDSSANAVGNQVIKRYVDEKAANCNAFSAGYTDIKAAEKVPVSRTVATLPLTADISAVDLMDALRPKLYKTNVLPNASTGVKGQFGIGPSGEVFFCTDTDIWRRFVISEELYDKMDLICEVDSISQMENGNLYVYNDILYAVYDDAAVAVAKANDVYTKTEIDAMLGNVESLLSAI